MAIGQDKPVTVSPLGIAGIVFQVITPQHLCNIGHAHGRTRMPGIRLLHCIHGKKTDGIGKHAAVDRLSPERFGSGQGP